MSLFVQLEEESFFVDFVSTHFCSTSEIISDWFSPEHILDIDRIKYAHREYIQNVSKFSVFLHSKNPDHYKRAGALLHALHQSKIIGSMELKDGKFGTEEDLISGFTMVSYGDAQHVLKFVEFYNEYYNQIHAFELAYRCCAAYQAEPRIYDFDYLRNICRYLKANTNLNVDSFFMIFKSLMI